MSGEVYPDLMNYGVLLWCFIVKVFYSNLIFESDILKTKVKGVDTQITPRMVIESTLES